MELKIYEGAEHSPIIWNNNEIKAEISAKMEYYRNVIYSDGEIKLAKEDRATLNKFMQALDTRRKEIKKLYLKPYEDFEAQLKDIISLINEPIALIDAQVKEYEAKQKQEKEDRIKTYYAGLDVPEWLTLDRIFSDKWLNASVSFKKVQEEIDFRVESVKVDFEMLANLPEIGFEASEVYKKTLDAKRAVNEANTMREMALAKQKQAEEKAMREMELAKAVEEPKAEPAQEPAQEPEPVQEKAVEETSTFYLQVTVTETTKKALFDFLQAHGIEYGVL